MIATLQSIDHLLNRFDELSQSHSNFLVEFDRKFTEYENPLRHIARTKDEQKQTTNVLLTIKENHSTGPLEDFHRRVLRSRILHRPPNYSSKSSFITDDKLEQIPQSLQIKQKNLPIVSKNELRNSTRTPITTFSMETVIRLSQPKRYNRLPEPKPPVNTKKNLPKFPTIKRSKPTAEKSLPKVKPVVRSRPSRPPVPRTTSNKSISSTKKPFRF